MRSTVPILAGSPTPKRSSKRSRWANLRKARLHETENVEGYAAGWVLWLGQVPYGIWSEYIAEPSMREFRHSAERLEREAVRPALEHFGLEMRPPWTPMDLGNAMMSMIEGLWLNQCLTREHPTSPGTPSARGMRDSLLMIWQGATQPGVGAYVFPDPDRRARVRLGPSTPRV